MLLLLLGLHKNYFISIMFFIQKLMDFRLKLAYNLSIRVNVQSWPSTRSVQNCLSRRMKKKKWLPSLRLCYGYMYKCNPNCMETEAALT